MEASVSTPAGPLPDDVATLQALVRQLLSEVARLRADNDQLRARLDAALKHRFGRRSERRLPPAQPKKGSPGKATPHGRSALPEHLERRPVVYDLTEAEKLCPCCGQRRLYIGEQTAEQLDLEPAHVFVRRTIKKSYACQHCDPAVVPVEQRLQTAGPEQVGPLAKGLCGPGLLAFTITAKFADHTPLHRLAGQLARSGVTIARSTLGDWMAQAADLLEPLSRQMHQRLLRSRVIHGDDTAVKLRLPGAPRTSKAYFWVCIGDADYPYVVFDFTVDHTAAGPVQFLAGYQGYLQADALAQYEGCTAPRRSSTSAVGRMPAASSWRPPKGATRRPSRRWTGSASCTPWKPSCRRCCPLRTIPGPRNNGGSGKSSVVCGGSNVPVRCWPR
jgi:transposase